MIIKSIPLVFALGYFLFFIQKNGIKNLLVYSIFLSFFIFASNYTNFGLDFNIYRYIHRFIGITIAISLFFKIIVYKINFFKDSIPQIFLLFFLVLIISFVGNDLYMPHYIHYVRNFIFIGAIVVYLFYQIDSNEKLEDLFKFILVITLILSFFVICETFYLNWVNFETHHIQFRRINLYFGNSNYLAFSLFIGLVLSLYKRDKFYPVLPLVILFAIVATASRSMILGSFISIIIHFGYQKYRLRLLIPSITMILLLFFIFSDRVFINTHNSSARLVIANITMNIMKQNPLNGIGYGQFRTSFHKYINQDIVDMESNEINESFFSKNPDTNLTSALWVKKSESEKDELFLANNKEKMTHNDLLTVVSELGLIGVAFLIFLFYKLYIQLMRLLIEDRRYFFLSLSLISGTLTFSMFHNNITSFIFWFILLLPFILNRNLSEINKI